MTSNPIGLPGRPLLRLPAMDPKPRFRGIMLAPGALGQTPALRCPPDNPWPRVDDHLVEPETSRDEVLYGQRMQVMGALAPHADRQAELIYVLRAHVHPDFIVSTELQTRSAFDSDFATDACIRKKGNGPRIGTRYLEEFACEVVSEQCPSNILTKAEDLVRATAGRKN